MKKTQIVILSLIISGCSLLFNHPHPNIKKISYYNENFKYDPTTELRLDGIYYKEEFLDSLKYINYLRFYSNGMVTILSTPVKLSIADTMWFPDEIKGNYKFENDTIYFAVNAHYFKKEKRGKIYIKDSMLYKCEDLERQFEEYHFLRYGTMKSDY